MDNYILQTSKKTFSLKEPVEFSLQNNSKRSVFVLPNIFDSLSFFGNLLQKQTGFFGLGKEFAQVITFDTFKSATDHAERTLPEPRELKPGQSVKGKWTGLAFKQTGPDDINDWKSFTPKGKFKIQIKIFSKSQDAARAQNFSIVESNEFERG